MAAEIRLSLSEIESLAKDALVAAGANEQAASSVAKAVMAAERDGIASHGLAYVPTYCEHLGCGKVNRVARPTVSVGGAVVTVDADSGFAHPAIELGFQRVVPLADEIGVAAMAVRNSYNCGVLGYHTQALAEEGLVGLGFTNAPASIAPTGALRPVLGTNPWSVAAPDGRGGIALLIDQSASVVAKSEVMKHARECKAIPLGWALDETGQPTTDASAALKGTMAPAGGYKGIGSALLVELFAAVLTGAVLGVDASPFSGTAGGPPRTGQFFFAINPAATSSGAFIRNIERLREAFKDGSRLPGARRAANARRSIREGILVNAALYNKVAALAPAKS